MSQSDASPTPPKNQRREIIAWCMYDWANSAYSTIYITVLVVYLQGAVLQGRRRADGLGLGHRHHDALLRDSLADPGRHRRRAGQQARLAVASPRCWAPAPRR